ncbi:extracellular solute-binding protein [Aureibacillus halotolerans]|uniref:Carbohydrate ABC transporter substrate-binding protein (CUT1 family) n=1 Tax=Aureibacillus halotolerans TaxID=1508390 RepID=A0A4R6UAQ6_9BACI|nr:extracellular solute-binding protein [Aureibacillus halotolerans]TDQ42946.1 carbohydrate ABC transporter substrate-binding protein (CUT1 family) [Aureibacillus halotolerans]
MKKWLTASLVTMLVLLSACGSGSGDSASGDGGNAEDKVTLTLWNIWTDPSPQNEANLAQVEKFMEEHPDIIIEQQSIPHDQYKVKLKTQAAGNELPDLMQVWPGSELSPLVSGGLLQPIDDIVGNWDGLVSDAQLRDYGIDGSQYAIPAAQTVTGMIYYDKDILAEAGYEEFPKTYEEFKQLITDLRSNDIIPITLGNKAQWILQSTYISAIGDRMTGSDFLSNVVAGEASFTDERFVKAVGVIQELAEMNAFNEDFNAIDNIQHRVLFTSGEAAMMIDGAWSLGSLKEQAPEGMNIGIAKFPTIEGGDGNPEAVPAVVGTGIAINSDLEGAELEAAKEFLKGFYTEDLFKAYLEAGVVPAANVEAPEGVDPLVQRVAELSSGELSPVYDSVLSAQVISTLNSGLQEVTLGTKTPEELAEDLQAEIEK